MLVGHFAVAFIGKRIEPRLSLGSLTLASMFSDILWPIFSIAGIEYVAGGSGAAGYSPSDIAFSHSLAMVVIWAALFAGAYFLWRYYRYREHYPGALWILFAAVWPIVAFLTFVWITNIRKGSPPPEAVIGSLIFFLILVAWAYWMNQARPAHKVDMEN